MVPTEPTPIAGDVTTIIDNLINAREGNLISVAFWKNMLTNVLAVALVVLSFFHPGYHLPQNLQALVDIVIPSVSVIAVAVANTVFARGAHQVRQTQMLAATENRRLALEGQRLSLDRYALSIQERQGPGGVTTVNVGHGDSGQPVTPTTP